MSGTVRDPALPARTVPLVSRALPARRARAVLRVLLAQPELRDPREIRALRETPVRLGLRDSKG